MTNTLDPAQGIANADHQSESTCRLQVDLSDRTNCYKPGVTRDTTGTGAESVAELLPLLGDRYCAIRLLGQGAMGAVYLCRDSMHGSTVAVKILPTDCSTDQQSIQRFQKEARLLSEVKHPNVANLLDVGHFEKTQFLVMELVEGTDLRAVIKSFGTLPEPFALQIAADVASALSVAHNLGIIHRDIKPANVLLTTDVRSQDSAEANVLHAIATGQPVTAKLTDFGLARHVDQAASLELTRTGMMLGTPYYISPEQCTGKGKVTPSADIYSLGATLFELLTGRPPFPADDPIKLITMHCFEQAPDPRKINPEISDGTAALLARTLQKSPTARYANAAHMLEELSPLLNGEITSTIAHPAVPAATDRIFEAVWEWNLDAEPEKLWPHVSNTERVNAATGVPPVEYVTRRDELGNKHRYGSFKLGWTRLSWEEHPFEWIEGRRFSILREFENGPFQWFVSTVELVPRPEGGSLLKQTVRIATRGLLGRLIAHIEVNWKGRKPLDRVYRRIDDVVCGRLRNVTLTDPFSGIAATASVLRRKLAAFRERVESRIGDISCLDGFLDVLAECSPRELARIRPRALARQLHANPDELTLICLEACHAGLLELHWDIVCPTCRVAASVKNTLHEIGQHSDCEACDSKFEVDFSSSVEMIFRVHPEFRQADLSTYCVGGPEHAPHVIAQIQLQAGEVFDLDLNLDYGSYLVRGPQLPYTISLAAVSQGGCGRQTFAFGTDRDLRSSAEIRAGRQLITMVNNYSHPLLLRLERTTARKDVLSATEAMQLPDFQRLFPGELVSRERVCNMSTCTLLAARTTNVLDLFADLGDSEAATQLQRIFQECRKAIESHGGKMIKEQDDRFVASFDYATRAIDAAIQIRSNDAVNGLVTSPDLQVALHRGVAMTTSVNGRLEYFGRSVAVVTAMLGTSELHRFMVSQELADDDDCCLHLAHSGAKCTPVFRSAGMQVFEVTTADVVRQFEASSIPAKLPGKATGESETRMPIDTWATLSEKRS